MLYNLFYKRKENDKVVKIITIDILPFLDNIALAYWAMDDGSRDAKGYAFNLHTEGYSIDEAYLLAGMLHYRFNLHCTVQNNKRGPRLYIRAKSLQLFKQLVSPHFHPSMLYKLTLILYIYKHHFVPFRCKSN